MVAVQIERVDSNDLSLLIEWRMRVLDEVFAHWQGKRDPGLREANLAYYERHLGDDSNISCFACCNDDIVGCGALCILEEMPSPENPTGAVGYLMNIYVVPEHRGRGIGSDIVSWLLQQARERGITKIMLETTAAGREVYTRLGFVDASGYMILSRKPERASACS